MRQAWTQGSVLGISRPSRLNRRMSTQGCYTKSTGLTLHDNRKYFHLRPLLDKIIMSFLRPSTYLSLFWSICTLRLLPSQRHTHGHDLGSGTTQLHPSVLLFFFFKFYYYLFIYFYFWLCWVFVSVRRLSPIAASGGHSSSRCTGLSLSCPLLLRSTGSRRAGSVVVAHGPSCSAACGISPDQGSNPRPLHRQADPQPLRHQGSPCASFQCRNFLLSSPTHILHLV